MMLEKSSDYQLGEQESHVELHSSDNDSDAFDLEEEVGLPEDQLPFTIETDLKQAKFFVAVAKEGIHSFLILGFKQNDEVQILHKFGENFMLEWQGQLRLYSQEQSMEGQTGRVISLWKNSDQDLCYLISDPNNPDQHNRSGSIKIALGQDELTEEFLQIYRNDILREIWMARNIEEDEPSSVKPCKVLFASEDACLIDEFSFWPESGPKSTKDITYFPANEISFKEYQDFLNFIRPALLGQLSMYMPLEFSEDKVFWVKKQTAATECKRAKKAESTVTHSPEAIISSQLKKQEKCLKNSEDVKITNTCRTMAIKLGRRAAKLEKGDLRPNVPSLFFQNLPIKTQLTKQAVAANGARDQGRFKKATPRGYFYILPSPPRANLSVEKKGLLIKIYKRMEDLVKKAPDDEITIKKFEALKLLYQQCLEAASMTDVRSVISSWKAEHGDTIKELRAPCFFSRALDLKSSTEKMIDEIEQSFETRDTSILRFCPSFEDMVFRF